MRGTEEQMFLPQLSSKNVFAMAYNPLLKRLALKSGFMLNVDFCGVKMKNPTRLASGVLGVTASSLIRVAKSGAGAVTMKSVGPIERTGHNNPTVIDLEFGLLNAVGLPSPGYKNMDEEMHEDCNKMMGIDMMGGNHAQHHVR